MACVSVCLYWTVYRFGGWMERMGLGRGDASCCTHTAHCSCVWSYVQIFKPTHILSLQMVSSAPIAAPVALLHLAHVFRLSTEVRSCGVPYPTAGNALLHVMDSVEESEGFYCDFKLQFYFCFKIRKEQCSM